MAIETLDLLVLGVYFVATVGVGLWFGRGERDTRDFFLGGKRQHWLVVALSILGTEVSALTFLVVPGRSYESNCWYLQMYVGALTGRVLIAYLLLPAFYGGQVTTVYEYLGQRFGPWTRATASLMFFASRTIGSGIRLLASSMALALIFDWPLEWVLIVAAGAAIAYTTFGGIKAIIWTDALQAIVFVGAAVAALIFLFHETPGSWSENLAGASDAGKLRVFNWSLQFNDDRAFWVLMIHATVQNMAALGADQDLTQRMLTCPDLRRGQRSLLLNAVLAFPVVCLFLLLGVALFAYYHLGVVAPPGGAMGQADRVFTHFIASAIPAGYGLKGLVVTGIVAATMSSLDSALGALSSTAVTDFYRPYFRRDASELHYLRVARLFTVAFGGLLVAVALAFSGSTRLLEDAFGWVGLMFGGMLGVFLVGVTTVARGADRMNVVAMLSSVAVLIGLKICQSHLGIMLAAWPWWVVIGCFWTCLVAVCFPTRAGGALASQ